MINLINKKENIGGFSLELGFFEWFDCVRDTFRQKNSFKILRIEMENYSHHHDNGNILNRISMDIDLFNTNL
jgi:hypothetical protein